MLALVLVALSIGVVMAVAIAVVLVAGTSGGEAAPSGASDEASDAAAATSSELRETESDADPTPLDTEDVEETETAEESPAAAERTSEAEPTDTEPTEPEPTQERTRRPRREWYVARIVDGDTIELGNGEHVRIIGIDTPERGVCGYQEASDRLRALIGGESVVLTPGARDDRDRYDRLLRYVDLGRTDAGLRLIREGLAIARYDSRDGYGHHPREDRYVRADRNNPAAGCAEPAPSPTPAPQPFAGTSDCASGYSPCVPAFPPDVDCGDLNGPINVTGSDPHGLDRDGDGTACE